MPKTISGKVVKKKAAKEREVEETKVKKSASKKEVKEEKAKPKKKGEHLKYIERKGRAKGVVFVFPEESKEELLEYWGELDSFIFTARVCLTKLLEGNKTSVRTTRVALGNAAKVIKDFRAAIQASKDLIEAVEAEEEDDDDDDDD